jgi:NodT family efflux transporter outer membrane factor (OMF) lipoprotein
MNRSFLLLLGFSLFGASCAHVAPQRDAPEGVLPRQFTLYDAQAVPTTEWWTSFDSAELDLLITQALTHNFSLLEAVSRLRQAEASAIRSGAARLPELSGLGDASRGRTRTMSPGGERTSTSAESYGLGLSASYELDLWGRVRSVHSAARLDRDATEADLSTAVISLSAEIAGRWISLLAAEQDLAVLGSQLKANGTFLELLELRYRKSSARALDVLQQRQVVAGVEASIPLARQSASLLRHELSLLLGKMPKGLPALTAHTFPPLSPLPPTGLPADLLAARPDVRAAGLRLQAADWRVSAARADRLPALRLTGVGQYTSSEWDTVFDNWLYNLAGNLTGPIFDGGRRRAELDRTRAVADERLLAYRRTVVTAVKDVEDALVREQRQQEHVAALERQLAAARAALEEARNRYQKGASDYLPVLTELLTTQRLERNVIQQRAEQFRARIALHRALGGSWMNEALATTKEGSP